MQVCGGRKKIKFPMVRGIHFPEPLPKAPSGQDMPWEKKPGAAGFFPSLGFSPAQFI